MTKTSAMLEPIARKFVENLEAQGGKPLYQLSFQDARQVLENLQSQPVDKLPADIEDRTIPGGPKGQVSIRIVRPQGARQVLPAIMYFHGGGWILGSKNTHDRLVREIANGTNAAVVFVNYSPAPEAKYPDQIEEAYAAMDYVYNHGDEMNLDGKRLAVAGDSVGGNMAAVMTILAKHRNGPKIAKQVLFYPVTDADFDNGSYREFANGPFLTKPAMEWFWNAYLPDVNARKQPTVSPLQASLEDLAGLPPALVITDENDVLRDEGEAYAHKLMAAGVDVLAIRYLGIIHDFVMLNALSETPEARNAIDLANMHLMKALGT